LAHQVFVSYATEDAEAASRLCSLLEAEGVGCWLASRDINEDSDRAAAILEAIRDSNLVLLLFSARANTSSTVLRDIERAIGYERPVLSIHLDDAVPNPSLEYYLNMWQWLDASGGVEAKRDDIVAAVREQLLGTAEAAEWRWLDAPGGVDARREEILTAVQGQLARTTGSGADQELAAGGPPGPRRMSRRTWAVLGGVAVAVLALALGLGLGLGLQGAQTHQGAWTMLEPTTAAPIGAGFDYDVATAGLVVLKGGEMQQSPTAYWTIRAYDPVAGTWTQRQPAGRVPPPLLGAMVADDPVSRRLIMFGGADRSSAFLGEGGGFFFHTVDNTRAFDYATNTWEELTPSGSTPPPRMVAYMAYDPTTRHLIMFGGWRDLDHADQVGTWLDDTWAYDPAADSWTELKPPGTVPSPRGQAAMVYDPSTGRIILFGGSGDAGVFNDIWAYSPAKNTWTELRPEGPVPEKRYASGLGYDSSRHQVVMFGGANADDSKYFADIWVYDFAANAWTELKPSGALPGGRRWPTLKYSEATDQIIMFAGTGPSGDLKDLWAFER
jgi:hypothetical protein